MYSPASEVGKNVTINTALSKRFVHEAPSLITESTSSRVSRSNRAKSAPQCILFVHSAYLYTARSRQILLLSTALSSRRSPQGLHQPSALRQAWLACGTCEAEPAMASVHVLRSYRELFRLIKRLPVDAERQAARLQAQTEMRKHAQASDEQVSDLHRILVSKISFLRMRVPKLGTRRRQGGCRQVCCAGRQSCRRCWPECRNKVCACATTRHAYILSRKILKLKC